MPPKKVKNEQEFYLVEENNPKDILRKIKHAEKTYKQIAKNR